ncbi:hypothetical protein DOTSEDRAFT_28572 [Dothistroma septosporum NZE10]|uniref:ATP-dependent DNA helicase n=1 Tax=Dothistroma septosporum (strain NZE10 / CBS 128990) TaxID=675120 RepID=M2YKM0_DOTSN|nr:hypothetical protein DOTSEDRAFT_28572 [Dothistroma septosporum NZE10]
MSEKRRYQGYDYNTVVRKLSQPVSKRRKVHNLTKATTFKQSTLPITSQEQPFDKASRSASVVDLTQDDEPATAITISRPGDTRPPMCTCGSVMLREASETVKCANESCKIRTYHKVCVGLSSARWRDNSNWRCRACRQTAPLPSLVPPTDVLADYPPPANATVIPVPLNAPEPPLHEEQFRVVDCIENGHNVFYTGSAGVGKSTVLKAFVKGLKAQGKHVDIIAPSGIAALAIGGSTIYSYAGWHPDIFKEGIDKLINKANGKTVRKRLCQTDVLVIDEISMVESDMLTRLDAVMRLVRHGWKPEYGEKKRIMSPHTARLAFGGAQIVITGDFCQLPPVKAFHYCYQCGAETSGNENQDGSPKNCRRCHRVYEDKDKWAFRSSTWTAAQFTCFELKHIHRQRDANFISVLQKCRTGQPLSPDDQTLLLQKKTIQNPVKLLPTKAQVAAQNRQGLLMLRSTARKYDCLDYFSWRNKEETDLQWKGKPLYPDREDGPKAALKDHRFEEQIELKVGMLAILLVNLDLEAGLVNGSQGRVIGFEQYDPRIQLVQRPPAASPSRNGRGSEVSDAMTEVAGLKEEQIRQFIQRALEQVWPVIEFNNGIRRTIYAHCQTQELGVEKPYSVLARTQIPVVAAWAITIHKSQGMTLDRVSVDLYSSFEKEMVYVALSRARTLEGLEVVRLPREHRKGMNEEVLKFLQDNGLYS